MGKHPAWLGKAMQSGGRAGQGDPEARQSATDRAERLRGEANEDVARGAAGSMVATGLGALAKGRKGIIGPAVGLGYLAKKGMDNAVKRKEASEADKVAAGEERKRGGRAKGGK